MHKNEVSARVVPSGQAVKRVFLERLAALLRHRDPQDLASFALENLISEFGATAASLLHSARASLHVRKGRFPHPLLAHIEDWEANVRRRILSGGWKLPAEPKELVAVRPVSGTDQTLFYSLIRDEETVTGSICVAFPQSRCPTGEERDSLTRYLEFVGNALNLTSEQAFVKERLTQLTLFYQISQSMVSTFDLQQVLDDTMQLATAVLDAGAAALMLVDEKTNELIFEYAAGDMVSALHKQRTLLDEGIAGWVATHGVPVISNKARTDPRFSDKVDARTGFLTQSVICVPIQMRGKTIGVLEALNKRSEAGFDSEDLNLMIATANQSAIAIENARLYQSVRDERDRIIQSQETVRRQVARNLHDGTIQFLSAITMGIDHLERLLALKPEDVPSELGALRALARSAMHQARLALFELRPLVLETQGLVPAMQAYVDQLHKSESFRTHLEVSSPLPEIDRSAAGTVFAIVQEAVNNAKKHARAQDIWLRLSGNEHQIEVVIEDNGKGFDKEKVEQEYDQRGSLGLLTMQERAELIEGVLLLESRVEPPTGTKITLRVPAQEASSPKD